MKLTTQERKKREMEYLRKIKEFSHEKLRQLKNDNNHTQHR